MRKGKMVAQGAHASMGAILAQMTRDGDRMTLDLTDQRLAPWITGQFKKICVYVNSEAELLAVYEQARSANIVCSLIQDSGLTEFNGVKTYTAVAVGPDLESVINAVTGNLPLL